MLGVNVKPVTAAVIFGVDTMRREAAGVPMSLQPARCFDFTPYSGLRVLAVNAKGNPHA